MRSKFLTKQIGPIWKEETNWMTYCIKCCRNLGIHIMMAFSFATMKSYDIFHILLMSSQFERYPWEVIKLNIFEVHWFKILWQINTCRNSTNTSLDCVFTFALPIIITGRAGNNRWRWWKVERVKKRMGQGSIQSCSWRVVGIERV